MTGRELAAIRKAAGLSQSRLGKMAGIGRHAVSYWECKAHVDRNAWAVDRIGKVLKLPPVQCERLSLADQAESGGFAAKVAAMALRWEIKRAKRRVRCGAKTRKGTPCRCQSEPGKRRCKFHGGRSTGPRTAEGRDRIREGQTRRWERWRADKGLPD